MEKSGGLSTELKQKIGGTKVAVIGSMAVDLIAEVPTVTPVPLRNIRSSITLPCIFPGRFTSKAARTPHTGLDSPVSMI